MYYAGGAAVVRGRPQLDIGLHARLRRGSCVERRDGLRRRLAGNSACRARLFCHTNTDDCRSARADQQRHRRETRARNLTRNYIKYARNICRAWLGRYPTGSGARTVVARPPSGSTRRAPRAGEWDPARAPRQRRGSQWGERAAPPVRPLAFRAARFESPTRRPKAPSGNSQWDLRRSHSEVAAFRVGSRGLPSRKSRGAEREVTWTWTWTWTWTCQSSEFIRAYQQQTD